MVCGSLTVSISSEVGKPGLPLHKTVVLMNDSLTAGRYTFISQNATISTSLPSALLQEAQCPPKSSSKCLMQAGEDNVHYLISFTETFPEELLMSLTFISQLGPLK